MQNTTGRIRKRQSDGHNCYFLGTVTIDFTVICMFYIKAEWAKYQHWGLIRMGTREDLYAEKTNTI